MNGPTPQSPFKVKIPQKPIQNPWGKDFSEVIPKAEQTNLDSARVYEEEAQVINKMWTDILKPSQEVKIEQQEPEIKNEDREDKSPQTFSVTGELRFGQPQKTIEKAAPVESITFSQSETVKLEQPKDSFSTIRISEYVNFGLFFNETYKFSRKVHKTGKEAGGAIWDLLKVDVLGLGQKKKVEKKNPEEQKKEEAKKKNIQAFIDGLRAISQRIENKALFKEKREDINKKVGASNLSYEGFVDSSGQVRVDIETLLDKANSQLQEEQLKTKREKMLAGAGKGKAKKGPGVSMNLNKAVEDPNNVTKLLG